MTPLRCQVGLNGLNFFVGAIQTAFGPFFTVYLTQQGWSQVDIGVALSVGTAAALVFQLPAGALVDHIHYKRIAIAFALLLIGLSALVVVAAPTVQLGPGRRESLHAFAGCLLDAGDRSAHVEALRPRRVQRAARHQRPLCLTRQCVAAAALGGIAYYVSEGAVFVFTAL